MGWTVDNQKMKISGALTAAQKATLNDWAARIGRNTDPKTASSASDMDYEVLKGATSTMKIGKANGVPVKCCSIRLSQGCRAYFVQIDSTKQVVLLKVGDHVPPNWPSQIL